MTRRIVLHMMMSADGCVASADDAGEDWMTPDPDRDAYTLAVARSCELGMAGHGVYHDMVGYWPTAEGETDDQRSYIELVNAMPKLIVTHADVPLEWNASAFVVGDGELPGRIAELKASDGGDIVLWGGAGLVQQFAAHGLIDEYQLMVQPIALGTGRGLFADLPAWQRLRLVDALSWSTGTALLVYRPET